MNDKELFELGTNLLVSANEKEKKKGVEYIEQAARNNYPDALVKLLSINSANMPKYLDYLGRIETAKFSEYLKAEDILKTLYDYIAKIPAKTSFDDSAMQIALRFGVSLKDIGAQYYYAKLLLLNTKYRDIETAKKYLATAYCSKFDYTAEEQALIGRTNSLGAEYKTLKNEKELFALMNCMSLGSSNYLASISQINVLKECRSKDMCEEMMKLKLSGSKPKGIIKQIASGELKPIKITLEYHPVVDELMEIDDFSVTWRREVNDETTHTGSADIVNADVSAYRAYPQTKFFDIKYAELWGKPSFDFVPDNLNYVIGYSKFNRTIYSENLQTRSSFINNMDAAASNFVASEYGWYGSQIKTSIKSGSNTPCQRQLLFMPIYMFEYESNGKHEIIRVSGFSDNVCVGNADVSGSSSSPKVARPKGSCFIHAILLCVFPIIGNIIYALSLKGKQKRWDAKK